MKLFLVFFIIFVFFFVSGCATGGEEVVEYLEEEEEKEAVVVVINGTPVTEEEIEEYVRQVTRDANESLSVAKIREEAIEKAIRKVVVNSYFEKKGIGVSEEEINKELFIRVLEERDVESKEEYFDLMARRGFGRAEVERNLIVDIKIKKALSLIAQGIEVTEEEAREYYQEELKKEGVSLHFWIFFPFEEVKDTVREDVIMIFAMEELFYDLDKERENVQIEIVE